MSRTSLVIVRGIRRHPVEEPPRAVEPGVDARHFVALGHEVVGHHGADVAVGAGHQRPSCEHQLSGNGTLPHSRPARALDAAEAHQATECLRAEPRPLSLAREALVSIAIFASACAVGRWT